MTIVDKIKDQELQYDINREAAEKSALSSGKIDKYKKILLLDQRKVTEQAKFTYSPLGKAFNKEMKTIKDQGEKQIKILEEHEKQLVKSNAFAEKKKEKSMPLDNQKEIFYNLEVEKTGEIEQLHNKGNFQNLIYHSKGATKDIDITDLIDAETLFDDIKPTKIRFDDVVKNQRKFESKLSSVEIGGNKSNKQLSKIENITKFYKL